MKRTAICLLTLGLLLLNNVAHATNWAFVCEEYGTKYYVDGDSAIKTGTTLIYWELSVINGPTKEGWQKLISKWEIKLENPRRRLQREFHLYTSDNMETHNSKMILDNDWSQIETGSIFGKEIEIALKYVKDGLDLAIKPDLP